MCEYSTISLMDKQTSPLRVGFDMDGVLLYNPARIIRPLISLVKRLFLHKKKLKFYYPKTSHEKLFWRFVHKSSIFNASGLSEITRLVKEGKIEAYLITARYNFLGDSVLKWVKKNNLNETFKGVYFNAEDEQPHEFKDRMINKLKLDMYVEDNFDIVEHISKNPKVEVIWIYNILDRHLQFNMKAPTLQKAIERFIIRK